MYLHLEDPGKPKVQVSSQNQLTTLKLPESPKRRALEKLPMKPYGDCFEKTGPEVLWTIPEKLPSPEYIKEPSKPRSLHAVDPKPRYPVETFQTSLLTAKINQLAKEKKTIEKEKEAAIRKSEGFKSKAEELSSQLEAERQRARSASQSYESRISKPILERKKEKTLCCHSSFRSMMGLKQCWIKCDRAEESPNIWRELRFRCQKITQSKAFDQTVMFVILCNSVLLAMDDPTTESDDDWQEPLEITFTILFAAEFILKLTSEGIAYFRCGWNCFDFLVVVEGLLSSAMEFLNGDIHISWIRALRVLRPLRTVKRFPSMRLVVMATFQSFQPLRRMLFLYLAFLVACATVCCNLWAGKFHSYCYDTLTGDLSSGTELVCVPEYDASNSQFCRDVSLWDTPFDCSTEASSSCVYTGQSPNSGLTSFDHLGIGLLVLFEVTTLDGWVYPLQWAQMATSTYAASVFVFVVVFGSYILVNMIVAALLIEFQSAQNILSEEYQWKEPNLEEPHLEDPDPEDVCEIAVPPSFQNYHRPNQKSHRRKISGSRHFAKPKAQNQNKDSQLYSSLHPIPDSMESIQFFPQRRQSQNSGHAPKLSPVLMGDVAKRVLNQKCPGKAVHPHHPSFDSAATGLKKMNTPSHLRTLSEVPSSKNQILPSHQRWSSLSSKNYIERMSFASEAFDNINSSDNGIFLLSSAKKSINPKKTMTSPYEDAVHRSQRRQNVSELSETAAAYVRQPRLISNKRVHRHRRSPSEITMDPLSKPHPTVDLSGQVKLQKKRKTRLGTLIRLAKQYQNLLPNLHLHCAPSDTAKKSSTKTPSLSDQAKESCFLYGIKKQNLRDLCNNDQSLLSKFILGCIFLNIIFLALDSYEISTTLKDVLKYSNYVFVGIFTLEMGFKLFVLGTYTYFRNMGNFIDAVIVAASWIELLLLYGASLSSLRVLSRIFRALRVTRISKAAYKWPTLLKVIRILSNSFHGVGPVLCLAVLLLFVFSVLGMQIFGSVLDGSGDSTAEVRYRFDSFIWAFFSVFYLLIGDNWSTMMMLAMEKTSKWACLYFIGVILAGNWILINMILAIVLSGCTICIDNRTDIAQLIHQLNRRLRRFFLRYAWRLLKEHRPQTFLPNESKESILDTHSDDRACFIRKFTRQESQPSNLCLVHGSSETSMKVHDLPFSFVDVYKFANDAANRDSPSYSILDTEVFKSFKGMRRRGKDVIDVCYWLSTSKEMHYFMMFTVVVSWLLMFNSSDYITLWVLDVTCTFIFAAEVLWKSLAHGFYSGKNAFVKSKWNLLDLFCVICSVILNIVDRTNNAIMIRVFSALKSLRPARLICKVEECAELLDALMASLSSLGSISIIIISMWFTFGIIGMQLFKGTFYSCSDENFPEGAYRYGEVNADGDYISPPCSGTYINATTGEEVTRNYSWDNEEKHFDNIVASMLSILHLITFEGWQTPLFYGMDIVGQDYQPKVFNCPWSFIFFMSGCCIFGLYMVNLLVGAIFQSFIEKTSYSKDGIRLDANQRKVQMYQWRLQGIKPKKRSKVLFRGRFSQICFAIANSIIFRTMVMIVLCFNGLVLMISHANQSDEITQFQQRSNVFFAICFMVEAIIMIVGLGPAKYFFSKVHLFDFAVTLASVCGMMFYLLGDCAYESNFLLQLVITSRVFRTLSVISYFGPLRQYAICFLYPLPKLVNIFLLMLIGVFVYANVGHQIFMDVSYQSSYTNFRTLPNSLQLMAIATTGEFLTFLDETLAGSTLPKVFVYLFFISFFLMMSFLLVNMFVMFLVEPFDLLSSDHINIFEIELLIPTYRKIWSKLDPDASGYISPHQLPQLLLDLPSQIGVGRHDSFLFLVHTVDRIEMQPDYDYSFHKTLVSLCVIACFPDTLAVVITSQDLHMLFRKVWAVVTIKKWLKKCMQRRKENEKSNETSSQTSIVIRV